MASVTESRDVTIAGQRFQLRRAAVLKAAGRIAPEPIHLHYVVVGDRRFPPKQLVAALTGLDRADFTTHHARRALMRLGFAAGRKAPTALSQPHSPTVSRRERRSGLSDEIAALAGQWVVTKDEQILYFGDTAQEVVGWLAEHGRKADSMFRVPEDELAASGLAPL